MNYLAHGLLLLDDPYALAGAAVPDWLSVVDRKIRARSKLAAPWVDDLRPHVSAVARGVVQHHHDDDWFHQTRAFAELSLQASLHLRAVLPEQDGHRRGFLGHILVELLLDSLLAAERPMLLDDYYQAVSQVEPQLVEQAVNLIAGRPTDRLAPLIPMFVQERFLADYHDDARLTYRLNQVLRRVGLPLLPNDFPAKLPMLRGWVHDRRRELLPGYFA